MLSPLIEHTVKFNAAITDLFKLKHQESALILIYALIDRMAWLSVENEVSNGDDFRAWVNKFLLVQDNFLCTADDLWAARCALLHTGSVEANDTRKGRARKILYYGGDLSIDPALVPKDEVYVKVGMLHCKLIKAVSDFESSIKQDINKLETVNSKLKSIIQRVEVQQN